MKKLILSTIITCLFVFNAQAQDEEKTNDEDYNKWQARVRVVMVDPATYFYDNVDGIEVELSTAFAPEIDITYFLSRKMSVELMLTTSTHDVKIADGNNLGSISLLSPTLSLQHHFYSNDFKPYVGAGINYTSFYNEDAGDLNSIDYKNQVGYLIQAGLDYNLSEKWFINFDFKKVFLKTEVTANNDSTSTAEVNVDPIIIGFGVGMKF
ncbi:OmpW/AlkL family protein [Psychroserpens sp.]|uniref:OmpW/AlkL family protein n=1 Tax=Psychroserpens sp. TaxID=2020870 RepID=UPI003858D922